MSFADPIKDCLSAIFRWDRDLLEGATDQSRIFRETIDQWWANRLGIPHFTPRWAMQNFGTEIMRRNFHDDIWVMSIERRLSELCENKNVVFGDVRHVNEISLTRKMGGKLIRIKKGEEPIWFEIAKKANEGDIIAKNLIENIYQIHDSEMAWIGQNIEYTISNNGTKKELKEKLFSICDI